MQLLFILSKQVIACFYFKSSFLFVIKAEFINVYSHYRSKWVIEFVIKKPQPIQRIEAFAAGGIRISSLIFQLEVIYKQILFLSNLINHLIH
jgi:hypothetical protein